MADTLQSLAYRDFGILPGPALGWGRFPTRPKSALWPHLRWRWVVGPPCTAFTTISRLWVVLIKTLNSHRVGCSHFFMVKLMVFLAT